MRKKKLIFRETDAIVFFIFTQIFFLWNSEAFSLLIPSSLSQPIVAKAAKAAKAADTAHFLPMLPQLGLNLLSSFRKIRKMS